MFDVKSREVDVRKRLETRDFRGGADFGHRATRPENAILTVIGNISTWKNGVGLS